MKRFLIFILLVLLLSGTAYADLTDYVRLNSGVTPEMLQADYWLKDTGDSLLMTQEEIAALPENDMLRILEKADRLDTATVRADMEMLLKSVDPSGSFLNGKPMPKDMKYSLVLNANLNGISNPISIRYGYTVSRASLRNMPCNDFLGETPDDLFYDEMVNSECMPYLPVLVVHESKDGEWFFVYFYGFGGWVEKNKIALCPSRSDWLSRMEQPASLVVTGRELRLNIDRSSDSLSGLLLPMGTHLPLLTVDEAPTHLNGRETFDSYVVKLPVRGEDGLIRDEIALIPLCSDVSVGNLPYTSGNLLRQAFKLLGDRYGWAGLDYSNDCSGIVREIYLCFGIELPRTAGEQALSKNVTATDFSGKTAEEKLEVLSSLTPGSLLTFPGHIMIYLGMKDDIPYVISAVGSFATEDMDVGTVLSVNTVTVNHLNVHRRSGNRWLDDLSAALTVQAK